MRITKLNRLFLGLLMLLITACSPKEESTPLVIVVTATPIPTKVAQVVVVSEPTATAAETATPLAVAPSYPAGTLLKGSGEGVFYLTKNNSRQHIYNWDTFSALAFAKTDIVEVNDQVLDKFPLVGELTRLLFDSQNNLYWVVDGKRWQVNAWREVVKQTSYTGVLATQMDDSLANKLPLQGELKAGTLLGDGQSVYYFDGKVIVPALVGTYDTATVMAVPAGVLTAYPQAKQLTTVMVRLKDEFPVVNVRQGPGTEFAVKASIKNSDPLIAKNRTPDSNWFQADYDGADGWVATSLLQPSPALFLLPIVPYPPTPTAAPNAKPTTDLQVAPKPLGSSTPVFCEQVPLRGFGKAWSEHTEVQSLLGCPKSWTGGEKGTKAAVQLFQNGTMLWLEKDSSYDKNAVYVFFADGSFQRFQGAGPADPTKVGSVPTGFFAIGDKFGKAYWEGTGAQVKERLGNATTEMSNTAGAYQEFYNGQMFWVESIKYIFAVYELYDSDKNSDTYDKFFRGWLGYEDKF